MADNIKNYPNYQDYPEGVGIPGNGLNINEEAINQDGFSTNNSSVEDYQNQSVRTWNRDADPNTFIHRYGLFFDLHSNIEDPTLLGFTIEIDDSNSSPLFADNTTKHGAAYFIEKYSNFSEIKTRKDILTEFQKQIKMFFRSQESSRTSESDLPYVKSHYINSISGLGNLTKKIVKYPDDMLIFNLYEDVTMHSQYLAQLYNNLAYSYKNQKTLIPENLLRFNLVIKISEIRNFKTVAREILNETNPAEQQRYIVNVNSSQLVYTLYDCNFLFFDSINHGEEITMAGIGVSRPENKDLELRIKYKFINRFFKSTFLDDLDVTTNSRLPLNNNGSLTDRYNPVMDLNSDPSAFFGNKTEVKRNDSDFTKSGNISTEDRDKNTQLYGFTQDAEFNGQSLSKTDRWKQKQLDKIKSGFENSSKLFLQQAKQTVMGEVQKLENKVLESIRRKKGELLNQLINVVKDNIGVVEITPKNVYYGDQTIILQDFSNQLGAGLTNDITDFLQNVNNIFP